MVTVGEYLYGFTDTRCQPPVGLRGLGGVPVRVLASADIGAVVSHHPVQRMMPLRSNLEPHHRVVREISSTATLVPVAFGHVSGSAGEILDVLRDNHDEIRAELDRVAHKCEMGIKLSWSVANIFDFFVRHDPELRELRDRVFRRHDPPMADKLRVGELFAAKLTRERERLTAIVVNAIRPVACEVTETPPRNEKLIADIALLIERARAAEFASALQRAASLFDSNYAIEYSGPWPAYSFIRLRLQRATPTAAA